MAKCGLETNSQSAKASEAERECLAPLGDSGPSKEEHQEGPAAKSPTQDDNDANSDADVRYVVESVFEQDPVKRVIACHAEKVIATSAMGYVEVDA